MSSSDTAKTTSSAATVPASKPIGIQFKHVPTSVSTEHLSMMWVQLKALSYFLTAAVVSLFFLLIISRLGHHQDELSHQLLGFTFDVTLAASFGVLAAMHYLGNRKVASEVASSEPTLDEASK